MFCAESIISIFLKRRFTKFSWSWVIFICTPSPKMNMLSFTGDCSFSGCRTKHVRLQNDWWNDSPPIQVWQSREFLLCVCHLKQHQSGLDLSLGLHRSPICVSQSPWLLDLLHHNQRLLPGRHTCWWKQGKHFLCERCLNWSKYRLLLQSFEDWLQSVSLMRGSAVKLTLVWCVF